MSYGTRRGTVSTDSRNKDKDHHATFIFRHIRVLYDVKPLGKGSYGEVRYAYCDKLQCAAKLIHPEFFDDPSFEVLKSEFEKECKLMSTMRHPNVIQYLGYFEDTSRNRGPRLPVLLMELLDGSLTNYLDRHNGPVPFHKVVNFCHDIALGLDYLHNNNFMHRDLSSNNVLLVGEIRAKITDFGQSRLADPDSNFRIRGDMCPGCQVYMPPEALRDPPEYSSMLDSFSFGVLMIQMLTRKFPSPTKSTATIRGGIDVPVKEVERRRADIAKVDKRNPVLQLALYCIRDNEEERPIVMELCDRFSELKDLPEYTDSVLEEDKSSSYYRESSSDLAKVREIDDLKRQMEKMELTIKEQQSVRMQLEFRLEEKEQISTLMRQDSQTHRSSIDSSSYSQTHRPSVDLPSYSHTHRPSVDLPSYNTALEPSPHSSIGSNPPSLPSQPQVPHYSTNTDRAAPLNVQDLRVGHRTLRWYPCTRTPTPMYGGSAVVFHKRAYVNGQGQNVVYEYNAEKNWWSQLPPTPTASFTLAVVDNMLTTIGGYTAQNYSNNLYSLMEDRGAKVWMQTLPSMKDARVSPGAAACSTHLLVAGGEVQLPRTRFLANTVEMLNLTSRSWSYTTRLPKPVKRISMTICDNHFFIMGGITANDRPLTDVYYVSVSSIVSSGFSDLNRSAWKVAGTPLVYSSCTTLGDNMLSIGGWDSQTNASNHVYLMNPRANIGENPWTYIGQLFVARFDCMSAVLPGERLIVAGGRGQAQGTVLNLAELAVPI